MQLTKNVLICEDDPVQLRLLAAMITQAGYNSVAARTPVEAVAAARRCGIDAVVADVQLQDGNAFDLMGDLRHMGFDAPVFMASAYATEGVKARARAAGVRNFFDKPFNFSAIKSCVDAALRRPRLDATVLILESHPQVRASLQESAMQEGFRVAAVEDGAKALNILRDRGSRIDLFVMDLHAHGPSGGELVRKALEIVPALHVVGISGDARREEIREAYEAGAVSFIRKPVSGAMFGSFLKVSLRAARDARKMHQERRERCQRLATEPCLRRTVRWLKSYLHAPSGSRKGAILGALALATLAAGFGVGAGIVCQQVSESIAEMEAVKQRWMQMTAASLPGMGARREASPGFPQRDEYVRLMRESNDFTRRYYQDYLQELRWQGRSQPAPATVPQATVMPIVDGTELRTIPGTLRWDRR